MVVTQQREVTFKDQTIAFNLSIKKVKNLNLRVLKDSSICVSASSGVPLSVIDNFVVKHFDFIKRAQTKLKAIGAKQEVNHRYENGEIFYFLGKALTLQVIKDTSCDVEIVENNLVLRISDPDNLVIKQRIIENFWMVKCRKVFSYLLDKNYPVFKDIVKERPQLRIKNMKSRWGSCLIRKKIVTLNSRLISKDMALIEYVLLHELCHFLVPNHSPSFYSHLAKYVPDHKEKRKILNRS